VSHSVSIFRKCQESEDEANVHTTQSFLFT